MTPINPQTFSSFTHTQPKASSTQSHDRFSTGRGPNPSGSFDQMLEKSNGQRGNIRPNNARTSAAELLEEQQRQLEEAQRLQEEVQRTELERQQQRQRERQAEIERANNIAENLTYTATNSDVNLHSGVGAKMLRDLQHTTGPLTYQQVNQLVSDLNNNISFEDDPATFRTKWDQKEAAEFLQKGFRNMATEDGKPGLSAEDVRRTAARDGNSHNLSEQDIRLSSPANKLNAALRGARAIDLRSGVGAKALNDLPNIGSLTRQQTQTLHSDLLNNIQRTNPAAVTSTQLDQLSLVSLMLKGFERNAAEDGRPGFSAEDLRRTAARDGNHNVLSSRDV